MTQNYEFRLQNATYLLFFGAILVLFLVPLVLMIFQTARIYTFQRGNGVIVSSVEKERTQPCSKSGNCRVTYYQIVEYTKENKNHSFQTNQSYDFDRYKARENVKIFYNPKS